jgi:biotin carboxyl carrier protein
MGQLGPRGGRRPLARVSSTEMRAVSEVPETDARIVDPRAVRVALAPSAAHAEVQPIVLEPPQIPLTPAPQFDGADEGIVLIDAEPVAVRLDRFDVVRGVLVEGIGESMRRTSVSLLPLERHAGPTSGVVQREVIVDGWRVEVEIESERRASLRERARRGREEIAHGGPTHVRAIIPGRIISVSITPGDAVEAGQQLLVVEAMKMQNELRAPRDGLVSRVAVGVGDTIEVGDLLLVLE